MKSKFLTVFLLILLLFSGCTSGFDKAEVPPSLLCAKELQAKVSSPSFSGNAVYSILDDGTQKVRIISPDEAAGLTLIYNNGEASVSFDTLEVENSEAYLPENFFALILCDAAERVMKCSQVPQKEGDFWIFRISEGENSDVLRVTRSGLLHSFESPKNNLHIEFTDTNSQLTE